MSDLIKLPGFKKWGTTHNECGVYAVYSEIIKAFLVSTFLAVLEAGKEHVVRIGGI